MTPTDLEAKSTAERLRAAALALFAERGYGGMSMGDLADRVGIAKASLYNYYPSKEELLLDLVRRSMAGWALATTAHLEREGPLEGRVFAYLGAVVEMLDRAPQTVAILRLASSTMPEPVGPRVQEVLEASRQAELALVRGLIESALRRGEIDPADPEDLILFGEVFVNGLILASAGCPGRAAPVGQRLPGLWKLLWRGLSGHLPKERESA